jgi:integrase
MARIYRRPESAIWQCSYKVPGNPKPVRESTNCTDEAAAKRFLEGRIRETGFKKIVGPSAERVKFADLEKLITDDYKLRGHRMRDLAYALKCLRKRVGGYRAMEITSAAIVAYASDEQSGGAAAATINRQLAVLRRMFKLGIKHGLLGSAPFIELLPEKNARQNYFEQAEFLAIRKAIAPEYRDFISALYHTGVRRTQMAKLEWRDINWTEKAVNFRGETTKNGEPHTIPLAGEFGEAIEGARRARRLDCRYVFHVAGRPLCYVDGSLSQECRAAWQAALDSCGLSDRILHDFRRSAAHHLAKSGADEQLAMRITGHKTPGMYRRYNIIDQESIANAMRRRDAHLEAQPTERKVEKL